MRVNGASTSPDEPNEGKKPDTMTIIVVEGVERPVSSRK